MTRGVGGDNMLTAAEIAEIPLFAGLSRERLEDIARVAADIRLKAGDYVVHEGEPAALCAVVSGAIEVTKIVDGIERVIGARSPGKVFGEVPLIYGTQFQSSARATEPSRILRLGARDYHALAASAPGVAAAVVELAHERIGGLQKLASESRGQVVLVGGRWETEAGTVRRFLDRNQIAFDWFSPDDPALQARWPDAPSEVGGPPAIRLVDGSVVHGPQLRELARRLDLQTEPQHSDYDTVVIGGGPAGLAAAVYGASEGLRTLVVEREAPGGQAGTSSRIENYLGFPSGISGDELASRALRQAKRLGAEILVTRTIAGIDTASRRVHLDDGDTLNARTIILATGVSWRRLSVDGFDRLIGKGVYYGAARSEASVTQGLDVHLIGAGNSAGQAAMFFANHARTVTLIVRGDALEKSMSHYLIEQIREKSNIKVALRSEVVEIHGENRIEGIDIASRDGGGVRREDSAGLFVFIGADAETDWLPPEIARNERGYVLTGYDLLNASDWSQRWITAQIGSESYRNPYLLETSVPGIFACGDVRLSTVKRVASAVGEGSMAIAFVHQYLKEVAERAPRSA
jgi:thioredoxin reductase (NADPH)